MRVRCYAFDSKIGATTHLCLLSTYAIDRHQVDTRYHTYTSLRFGPQNLRFTSYKPRKALRLQSRLNHKVTRGRVRSREKASYKRPRKNGQSGKEIS